MGYFTGPTATQAGTLRLAFPGQAIRTITPAAILDVETFNRNGYFKTRFLSPDGRLAQYSTAADPIGLFEYALFFTVPDLETGDTPLLAGNADGVHVVSGSASVFDVTRSTGSNVAYTANFVFDPARFFNASTADLMVADAADPLVPPRLVSAGADLFYLPSGDRERLVFTSQKESAGPGLYVASARP